MKVLRILFVSLFVSITALAQAYTVFEENGKAGLKDEQGKIIIPARYDAIGWSNGTFSVINNLTGYLINSRWGLINLKNEKITRELYNELVPAEGGFFVVKKNLSHSARLTAGCIDAQGKEIIPFGYDNIEITSLRAIVFTLIGNQYRHGLIDLENKTLIPQEYQDIRSLGTLRFSVRNFEGKTALFTENGKQLTGFTIDSVSNFHKNYAVIYQGQLKGVVDREGIVKLPIIYRDLVIHDDGKILAKEPDEWTVLNGDNTVVQQMNADSILSVGAGRIKLRTLNDVIMVDEQLKPVVPAKFNGLNMFSKGRALYQLGDFYGIIDRDGKVILPAIYHEVKPSGEFILVNQRNGKDNRWILFDSTGIRRTTKTYSAMTPFGGGLAVKSNGSWGMLDTKGREIVACVYDSLIHSTGNHLVVKFKGLYGVINKSEVWKVTPRSARLQLINDDKFVEYTPSSTQLKSMNGSVIYFTSNKIEIFSDHLLEYLSTGNIWKIDLNGVISDRQVVPAEPTEKIYEEAEGYRAIKRNGRYGFIDTKGRLRIANRYEGVKSFSDGYAAIKILGKWGFINQQDNIAVQPVYEEVWPFKDGFALVRQKDMFGLIDKKGKQVLPTRYEMIQVLHTGNLLIEVKGVKGLADRTGKILIQPKYDLIEDLGNHFFIVRRDQKYGVVTDQGLSTIPLMYDFLTFDRDHKRFMGMKKRKPEQIQL
jgi:hypothetical protein